MFDEWMPFVVISVAAVMVAAKMGSTSLRAIRNLLIAGVLMRVVGVLARHFMIFNLYDGGSDAVGYFGIGQVIAQHFRVLDFSVIGSGQWGDREWGTQAVRYAAGLVMTFTGPSIRGTFLVFSLAAFAGLVCTVVAFGRANSQAVMPQAARLIFLWPSLWFWPSSIGKEALLLLAVGLVTLGYVGRAGRIQWLPMISGLGLALAIRPHLAGVLAISTCVAEWGSSGWTVRRFSQSILMSALTLWLLLRAFALLGVESSSYDSIQSFMLHSAAQTHQGGSAFERTNSYLAVPMAFVNILLRPLITEARSPMTLVSSLEMMAFWALLFFNGRGVRSAFGSWHSNRLLRFVVPFTLLYVLMLGLTFQNLGIIARQRALVMPAVLLVVAMGSAARVRRNRMIQPRPTWGRAAGQPSLAS